MTKVIQSNGTKSRFALNDVKRLRNQLDQEFSSPLLFASEKNKEKNLDNVIDRPGPPTNGPKNIGKPSLRKNRTWAGAEDKTSRLAAADTKIGLSLCVQICIVSKTTSKTRTNQRTQNKERGRQLAFDNVFCESKFYGNLNTRLKI